ncbi:MAG TPA: M56 family metallopeptidase [Allosphingosinicella sp.]
MTAWALDTLIGVTLLLLLVLAVRRPVARAFGAGWAYALWLLPLLRLFMPPVELLGGAMAEALPKYTVIMLPAAAAAGEAAAAAPAAAGLADWLPLLLALWAGGAGAFVMWQQSAYSAFLLSLGTNCRPGDPPIHGGVKVVESGAVDGPLAVGLLEKRIVVPLDFAARYSAAERGLALDHELVHHRRGDIFWNYVALALLALTWFSPVSWIAFRAFRTDQELACDAAVTARIAPDRRLDYAFAMVKSASRPGEVAACPMNRADQLKRRLMMVKQHRSSRLRSLAGLVSVAILGVAGLALSSPGFAQQDDGAAAPQTLVSRGGDIAPVVGARDRAVLAAKCAPGGYENPPRYRSGAAVGRVILCSDPAAASDPQVQAIVARSIDRARVELAAARPEPGLADRVAETAVRYAALAVEPFDRIYDDEFDDAHAARERAHALREAAHARSEAAHARAEAAHGRAEALREAAHARGEAAHARAEALRERGEALRERGEALREAAEARAEAARDRAEALRDRAEALREAAEARAEAQRDAAEAAREAAEARAEAAAEARAQGLVHARAGVKLARASLQRAHGPARLHVRGPLSPAGLNPRELKALQAEMQRARAEVRRADIEIDREMGELHAELEIN